MSSKYRCTGCKEYFPKPAIAINAGKFHSIECATSYAQEKSAKLKATTAKKKHTKAKKDIKDEDRSFQIDKTQRVFNAYVRLRDSCMPCISCARADEEIDYSGVGGKWDCGHYKTRGAYPELRFDERNASKQCKKCNGGSGKYSRKARSVKEGFDIGLLERYGQDRLDWLNGPHEPKRYTIANLVTLQKWYKRKIKRMERDV